MSSFCSRGLMRLFHSNRNSYDVTPVGGTSGTYNQPSSSTQANQSRTVPVLKPALPNNILEKPAPPNSRPDETQVSTVENKLENEEPIPTRRRSRIVRQNPEKVLENVQIVKYDKPKKIQQLIKNSLQNNEFLKNILDETRLQQVVDAMSLETVQAKQYVITEGDYGTHLYVSEEGTYEITKSGMHIKKFSVGETFGELAILYNTKRFASIQALTKGKIWKLDRDVYLKIMLRTAIDEQEGNVEFLKKVPQFLDVNSEVLHKVSNLLQSEFFSTGHMIIRQGEKGDKFYIIKVGSVLITKRNPASPVEETVGILQKGEYFGELALLQEDCRQASVTAQAPGVECLTLNRNNFIEHFGDLKSLAIDYNKSKAVVEPVTNRSEYSHIEFKDLNVIQTLGVGGFGRVELVQYKKDKNITFALKLLKKVDMVHQQQQEHAYNEKMIMYSCNSDFICKLYNTFKDAKYIYFLMEVCLGGDVWTILQKSEKRCFSEKTTKFMAGCVIEAFDYLHTRDIIYRDLKPENLLIDSKGYVKLVDFGFAKKLGSRGKTYTFAGTPEYVAPEIILNRGHDKAVDYWALGIFIHELVCGKPPFRASHHMKTYNLIIRGIDNVDFPPKMNKSLQILIRKLCRTVPSDRLGCQRNGIDDIRQQKWFLGFDWDALRSHEMVAPIKPHIKNNTDGSNFDKYSKDTDIPPDENSGWDNDF